jgi:hypothetical protein
MKYPVIGLCPRVGPEKHAQPRGEARGKVEATKEHDLGERGTMGKRAGVKVANILDNLRTETRSNITIPDEKYGLTTGRDRVVSAVEWAIQNEIIPRRFPQTKCPPDMHVVRNNQALTKRREVVLKKAGRFNSVRHLGSVDSRNSAISIPLDFDDPHVLLAAFRFPPNLNSELNFRWESMSWSRCNRRGISAVLQRLLVILDPRHR